jgi:hypothetical protein
LSPHNKDEECAKFTVGYHDLYRLSNVTEVGKEYTFGLWMKYESQYEGNGGIICCGKQVGVSRDWKWYTFTFVATDTNVDLDFYFDGTYYIYHPMLEIGNKASDWSPAPEDIDESIRTISDDVTDINTNFRPWTDRLGRHFKFSNDSEDAAITISVGNNVLSLELDPETGIIFSKNGEPFGSWDGENFYTGNIVVRVSERAQFGNFAAVPRADGGLSWLKVAGG